MRSQTPAGGYDCTMSSRDVTGYGPPPVPTPPQHLLTLCGSAWIFNVLMAVRSESSHPAPSVFLSYASEDRSAAQTLKEALSTYGLDVWYDESDLDGGDAWDQKIRRQIRECDFFMPLISAQTEARPEGYFRREWRLAVERTLDMADDHTFLLPVVIDDTRQDGARVPERFFGSLAAGPRRSTDTRGRVALPPTCLRPARHRAFRKVIETGGRAALAGAQTRIPAISQAGIGAGGNVLGPDSRMGVPVRLDIFQAISPMGTDRSLRLAGGRVDVQRLRAVAHAVRPPLL
jgi:hypothetical protein